MKTQLFRGAMITALLLAGCSVTPTTNSPLPLAATPEDPGSRQYSLANASTSIVDVGIASVSASSSSPSHPLSNVTDGLTYTAWGPAFNDTSPTLTFTLDQAVTLTEFEIKLSLGAQAGIVAQRVLVDVEVRTAGGDWTTIATGLTPQEASLVTLDVPDTLADEVRLSFRTAAENNITTLLVCDVGFTGTVMTEPKPSPMPSDKPSPTPTPSVTPTPTPTPTPSPACCVAVTGTSNVTVGGNAFNFEINTAANSSSGIGRVNFTDTRGTASPQDDVHAQWTIVATRCILEEGALTGAEVDADVDGDGTADVTFTLIGDAPGNSGSHVQVNDLAADVLTGVTLAFGDFDTTGPNADLQRSTQNVFPDDDCDGVPDPNTFPVD